MALAGLAHAGAAHAQEVGIASGYQGPVVRPLAPTDTGVAISEGVYLHAGIGAETGYDSNVFYQSSNAVAAPILRVVPFLEINNQVRGRDTPPTGLFFDLSATLNYRHYFSDNPSIDGSSLKDSYNPTFSGLLDFSRAQHFGFSLVDTFARLEEPPYYAGAGPLIRTGNEAAAQLRYSPGGGRAQGILRYTNRLDLFASTDAAGGTTDFRYADSLTNELLADLSWRWLPKTALFFSALGGFVHYLNPGAVTMSPDGAIVTPPPKFDSTSIRLHLGLRGLVTERTAVSLALGYATAFYDGGTDPSGLGQLSARGDVVFRPTPITAMSAGYMHEFVNSIVGNFYNVDAANLAFRQMIASRITASILARYEYRRFGGDPSVDGRRDNFLQVGAVADYYLRTWAYFGVGYNLYFNDSNFDGMPVDMATTNASALSASYTKHQVVARIGLTY